MKNSYMNEEVIIQKSDGTEFQVFALVSTRSLIVEDVGLVIEDGDLVKRIKRNGTEVNYRVITSSLRTPEDLPPSYLLAVDLLKNNFLGFF